MVDGRDSLSRAARSRPTAQNTGEVAWGRQGGERESSESPSHPAIVHKCFLPYALFNWCSFRSVSPRFRTKPCRVYIQFYVGTTFVKPPSYRDKVFSVRMYDVPVPNKQRRFTPTVTRPGPRADKVITPYSPIFLPQPEITLNCGSNDVCASLSFFGSRTPSLCCCAVPTTFQTPSPGMVAF